MTSGANLPGGNATTVHGRGVAARQVGARIDRAGMVRGMALLAQPRCPGLEQRGIVRAMRGVAGGAVLLHRLVTPQERAAPLGMAGITGLVDRVGSAEPGGAARAGGSVA